MKGIVFALGLAMYANLANAFPLVSVKSGSVYSSYSYIAQPNEEASSVINFDNVAVIRCLPDNALLIDGRVNVKFKNEKERQAFLNSYYDYVESKKEKVKPTEEKQDWRIGVSLATLVVALLGLFYVVC